MSDIAWNTIAGAVLASADIEPYFPPTEAERDALHAHTFRARVDVEAWEAMLARFDIERAADIKSYDALYSLWIMLIRWSIENGRDELPVCKVGLGIYEQLKDSMKSILQEVVPAVV